MKIKNSIRRKVLTSLLIAATLGTTVNGIGATKSFAASSSSTVKDTSLSEGKVASKELSDKVIQEIEDASKARWKRLESKYFHSPLCWLVWDGWNLYGVTAFGRLMVGTWTIGGETYHFDDTSGKAEKGWYNITDRPGANGRYYFKWNFTAAKNNLELIDGVSHLFDAYGRMKTGFQEWRGYTYYFHPTTGERQYGWLNLNGNIYRLPADRGGARVHGWFYTALGAMYFHHNSGAMIPTGVHYTKGDKYHKEGYYVFTKSGQYTRQDYGFYSENGKRYYFSEKQNGRALQNQWYSTGKRTSNSTGEMYFGPDGNMAKGVKTIDDNTYVFIQQSKNDWNYYQGLGWYTDTSTNKRYFFNDGKSARSTTDFRNAAPVGAAVKGTQVINGKTYQFDSNGVLIK